MRTSCSRWLVLLVAALGATAAVACSQADHGAQGAGPACKTDCGSGAVGGTGSGKDAGAATDAGAAATDAGAVDAGVDVTATVVTYGEPTFSAADAYSAAATLHADQAGGGTVTAAYGGVAGTSVALQGVAAGTSWLFVEDTSAARRACSRRTPCTRSR